MSAVTNLSPTGLSVDPGGLATTTIRIRNTGSIVDRFDVDVVGPTAGWARVDPPSLSLFPGAEGTATITFGPPRASSPRAGMLPFGVRVRPAADPSGSTVEEGRVTVTPFTAVTADIVPQTSRGSRVAHHEVVVDNHGNAPSEVVVTATDPDRLLGLSVQPPRAVVGPDQRTGFRVSVQVDDPFPFGPSRARPFQVSVEPGRQAPIQLRATMSQRAMFPSWIPKVAAAVAVVAVVGAGAVLGGVGPFAPAATPSPSLALASSLPSGAPSAPASVVPSQAAAESQAPSAPASPTPPPSPTAPLARVQFLDFELEDTGNTRQGVPKSAMNPTLTFSTDGPGDVTFLLNRVTGDNGLGLRMCLGQTGKKATCKTLKAPGPLTLHNDRTGTVRWTATLTTPSDNIAPFADVALEFFANRPSVTWTDNAQLAGDPTTFSASYSSFSAIVQAPATPTLFNVTMTFNEQPASFSWAETQVGAPFTLAAVQNASTFTTGPQMMTPNTFTQFRFVGQAPFDPPVTYSAQLDW